ncbi:sensor histidine kinase [Motiliproteus coralliicola]|uniref:histidine kinase n=1 Tax=Motiliproteus coralliicola TaxID=2283196 RepID=A0A369W9U6_9GAMM|nr:sensor histidine kinase [Motiliproteus coralliicola]RDE18778.1 sensor histidine kinase [Motiliproteus coralliicola]
MKLSLRALKLKTRMVLILGLIALLQTGSIGLFALYYLNQSLDEQIGERALHVAKGIAAMPQMIESVGQGDSENLQPLSKLLAERTQASFVVFGDLRGHRLTHPNPELIGLSMMSDDDDDTAPTLVHGRSQVTKAEGSMGWSMRARTPMYDHTGEEVIGLVSVGYTLDRVEATIARYRTTLILVILAAFVVSVLTAIWFANHFKQAIFGLEPEQIGRLFQERIATLESVREGIIAINADGRITTINRAAIETLGLDEDRTLTGRPISEVLPDSQMLDVLRSGEPQFDREVWLADRNLIVNRVPLKQDQKVTGVVSSFRRKDELDLVSRKLTRIQQYADTLRSQSHEYSNKLHTIAGLIQIGADDEALALIGQETRSHQELIRLLLAAVPDPILSGCLLGKYNRAREMGLKLLIDPDSHMAELPDRLPREQLVSIIGNLIDNALEATLAHTGTNGEVRLSMTDLGDDLIFEIEDQGAGVPDDQQERIFEKGVTSKSAQGHGLGLHLVKGLLQRLGGTITLEPGDPAEENPASRGSRFTVYIPKQPVRHTAAVDNPHG